MEIIQSFKVDHTKLLRGVYVSRVTTVASETIMTFDVRMTEPNRQPIMTTAEMHAIEHLAACYLRDQDYGNEVIYWGPMGCGTGFYLIMAGIWSQEEIVSILQDVYTFVRDFEGEVPGATPEQCGNYSDSDLPAAKERAAQFLQLLSNMGVQNLTYPML